MYAVIRTGGKQYKVTEGDQIVVEKLLAEEGEDVTFSDVLMLSDGDKLVVGEPTIEGACVYGEVVEQRRGKKIHIYKKRQRSTYRRKMGHRQYETVVNIVDVSADGSRREVIIEEINIEDEFDENNSAQPSEALENTPPESEVVTELTGDSLENPEAVKVVSEIIEIESNTSEQPSEALESKPPEAEETIEVTNEKTEETDSAPVETKSESS